MTDRPNEEECCCKGSDCCGGGTSRRDFLKLAGLAAASVALAEQTLGEAAPPPDLATLVPADKKLKADWLASLTARGEPAVYRGDDLKFIGMPIGGLCCGQLYLGGDGKLWHWDIFNKH
ncbi:MAG: twin-arginine translocation signal domain-containing protein, partial [Planctomycetota bacterium]|nr:twin-arginine translocation signal domain-containing protein [Planctomycetota bacterium]